MERNSNSPPNVFVWLELPVTVQFDPQDFLVGRV